MLNGTLIPVRVAGQRTVYEHQRGESGDGKLHYPRILKNKKESVKNMRYKRLQTIF